VKQGVSNQSRDRVHDVAIVGGGLVGASLACALAPLGLNVALVEAVPFRAAGQPSYDDRTLAVSYSSCRILEGLGIWPQLEGNTTPIRQVIVSERGRPGRVVLRPEEMGVDALGHVIEARMFGAAVLRRLGQLENTDLVCPAKVTGVSIDDQCAVLELDAGESPGELRARLLVAADGAASTVRRLLDIPARHHDYGQSAVICNVTPERRHHGRAFERLTPTGPFAVLPHVGNRCGLVWSVASDAVEEVLAMPEAEFLAAARDRFTGELGDFVRAGARASYPLKLVRAERDTHPRLVILGNAAHAIHPIGAQGFNLGLRDVAVLAEVLARPDLGDPGGEAVLNAYSSWRRPDHDSTIAWSDGMARLFANPAPLAAVLRSAGLLAHALVPPLRRQLASGAMGYRGRIPRLALGRPLRDQRS
jgi:2-octaprenyl-6-methoxyphenol hydroxylase